MNNIPIPHHINSAKALSENFKLESEKLDRKRKVQNSILSMNELHQKTNNLLKQSHDLQDLHIKTSHDQVLLISTLIDEQKSIRKEQALNSVDAKKSSNIQLWLNIVVLVLTATGLAFVIVEFYQKN